jgi:hypothetical protein
MLLTCQFVTWYFPEKSFRENLIRSINTCGVMGRPSQLFSSVYPTLKEPEPFVTLMKNSLFPYF